MAIILDTPWAGTAFNPASPVDIVTVADALVNRLNSTIGNVVEVAHFPDNPATYRLTHRVGAALVRYTGASYSSPSDISLMMQERTLEFSVALMVRDLGWAFGGPNTITPGAYQLLEAIRVALAGFHPVPDTAVTPLRALHEKFVKHEDGVWHYTISFSTRTVAVADYQTPGYPLFTLGLALDTNAQTTRSVSPANYTFSSGSITLANRNITALTLASVSGHLYMSNLDYLLNNVNGTITWLVTGTIPAGATVVIAYSYAEIVEASAAGGSSPFYPSN
jgi:hypothetical protein